MMAKEQLVEQRAKDLGPDPAIGLLRAGAALAEALRDQRDQHAAHRGEGVEGVGRDGDRSGPQPDAQLDAYFTRAAMTRTAITSPSNPPSPIPHIIMPSCIMDQFLSGS
jgi:hypothetical protein